MSNAVYASLSRQHGLIQEMQVVANNLANSSTTGYKTDRAVFAEYIVPTGTGSPSLSMGGLAGHAFEFEQGGLSFTGSQFDLAIQGEGFFVVQTEQGPRLTRAGHFLLSDQGLLVDPMGNNVLNPGGGPIAVPPEATQIAIGADGSISANGEAIGQVGIVLAAGDLLRDTNTHFVAPDGFAASDRSTIVQGALEQSNVKPVLEVARMIDVHRAYEAGQSLLEQEDRRLTQLISSVRER